MKIFVTGVAGVTVAALSGYAFADGPVHDTTHWAMNPVALTGVHANRGSAEFEEDWESFPLGPFDSDSSPSYTTSFDGTFSIVEDGIDGQSLAYDADGSELPNSVDRLLAPTDPTPDQTFIQATFLAESIANSYSFIPFAPSGLVVTQVRIENDGSISALQFDLDVPGMAVYEPTGLSWAADEVFDIAVNLNDDGTFNVLKNGVASTATLTDVSFAITGELTPGYSGFNMLMFNENAGVRLLIDNIVVPTPPGVAVLLGLGGLAAVRRRRLRW
ncbi:MAG: hypothetical protein AAGK04_02455 [Planctomycetota bacterium]